MDDDEVMVRYGWASLADPRCVSVVRGTSPEAVLRGLARQGEIAVGPGPVDAVETWAQEELEYGMPVSVVWAVTVGSWTVAVEENGWQGVDPAVAAPLSAGTQLASFYWSVNGDMTFLWATDGVIMRSFDPLLDYDGGVLKPDSPNGPPLAEEAGLPFGVNGAREAAFGLMERLTGVAVQPDLAASDRLAIAVEVG